MDHLTRADLETILDREGIDPIAYRLDGGVGANECYVLDHGWRGWEVYYAERGRKVGLRVFDSESEACGYFLTLVTGDSTTRRYP